MTARLASIWRHPIKAVGREAVERAALRPGETLPGDRVWAVAHDASEAGDGAWSRCGGFVRAASSPELMAVATETTPDGRLMLSHPARDPLAVDPDRDGAALVAWLDPLIAEGRPRPARIVRAPDGRGMTDTSTQTITLGNLSSHRVVEGRLGRQLSIHRWRCNLWVDGLAPWEEFDLVGQRVRLGGAVLEVTERVGRCRATEANPETGRRDADLLSVLDAFDHRDFTVGCIVHEAGEIATGDKLEAA